MALKVLIIFGTRPEAIKLVPVICALQQDESITPVVCVTGQHREMLSQVLELFRVDVDIELNVDVSHLPISQSLAGMLTELEHVVTRVQPDVVLVQGDTTSCMAGALAAFYNQIPLVHIEAGLRTGNLLTPYPEEAHRQMVSRIADVHMVPTVGARDHLLRENINPASIHITGNTVVDALRLARDMLPENADALFIGRLVGQIKIPAARLMQRMVLITLHRRESIGETFSCLCNTIAECARKNPDWTFVYPVHLNPMIKEPAYQLLDGIPNIYLLPPQDYLTFVWLLARCELVVTDSGGVQEEAEALDKPLLIVRDRTDRPESLGNKKTVITGTDAAGVTKYLDSFLLEHRCSPEEMPGNSPRESIFGNGYSAQKIVTILKYRYVSAKKCVGDKIHTVDNNAELI